MHHTELLEAECHWCELSVSRGNPKLQWIDEYESANCEFHPSVFDSITLRSTGGEAAHQTIWEVHDVVRAFYKGIVIEKPKRDIDSNVVQLSPRLQRTSLRAAANVLPRTGSMRRYIFDHIKSNGAYGMTDNELETVMNGKHQTISASRRSLVIDGWLVDSGRTRKNAQGNDCIVWVTNETYQTEMFFG